MKVEHRNRDETNAAIAKAERHYYRVTPYPANITRSAVREDRWVFLWADRDTLVAAYAIRWGKNRVDVDPVSVTPFLA